MTPKQIEQTLDKLLNSYLPEYSAKVEQNRVIMEFNTRKYQASSECELDEITEESLRYALIVCEDLIMDTMKHDNFNLGKFLDYGI